MRTETPITDAITRTKTCRLCGGDKPLTREHFYTSKKHKDGFRGECKACYKTMPSVIAQAARGRKKRG